MAYALAQQRYRLRRELEVPMDEHDLLAERLGDAVDEIIDPDEEDEGTAVLFWPRAEFDALLLRWPRLADAYGASWDEHRARLQRGLVSLSDAGEPRLAVLEGCVDGLADYAGRHGADPTDAHVRQGYVEHLEQTHPRLPWPPQRNETCWCGSGAKYKKCCLPRSRTSTILVLAQTIDT